MVNARPLTYVHDDTEGIDYALTPSHLIYGTTLPNSNHFEVLSTYETLTGRIRGHKILLWNLVKIWRKDYLLNLREFHSVKKRGTRDCNIAEGDVVILKDDLTKRMFWKMG